MCVSVCVCVCVCVCVLNMRSLCHLRAENTPLFEWIDTVYRNHKKGVIIGW